MKKVKLVLVACVTAMVTACGGSPEDNSNASNAAPSTPPVEVTAKEISAAFQENEVRAKAEYGDKRLIVTGKIKEIELDMMDNPVVKLAGANEMQNMGMSKDGKMTDVTVSGLSTDISAKLNKGEVLTVICANVAEAMGSAMLDKCEPAPNDEASAS